MHLKELAVEKQDTGKSIYEYSKRLRKILEKYNDRDAAIGDVIEQARYMMV